MKGVESYITILDEFDVESWPTEHLYDGSIIETQEEKYFKKKHWELLNAKRIPRKLKKRWKKWLHPAFAGIIPFNSSVSIIISQPEMKPNRFR